MLAISESAYIKGIKEFIKDPCEDGPFLPLDHRTGKSLGHRLTENLQVRT